MKWFGRLFCLVAAVGGFAAAQLLAQEWQAAVPTVSVSVPSVPLPTVTTPTLPVPSVTTPTVPVPVPSTPTPTVPVPPPATTALPPVQLPPAVTRPPVTTRPAPAPRPAQPTTSTTITVPSQPATRGTSPSPSPSRNYTPSSPSTSSSGQQRSSATPSSTARLQRKTIAATTHRSRNRVSVRLAFVLRKADRLFVVVRGPAPSCRVAGYIPVRGHKGGNTVFFAGRVHGHRLRPGVYLLSLSTNRRLDPAAATEYVRVRSPSRSVPLPEQAHKPSCSDVAGAATTDAIERTVLAEAQRKTSKPRPTASLAGTAVATPTGDENDDGASGLPDSGVLGAATDKASERPFVTIAVLTIVGGLLLMMLVLVTRFLRGSWNP